MRVLVLYKIQRLDVSLAIHFIANDEARRGQRRQPCVNINVVVREDGSLESFGAILKTTLPIALAPQALEKDAVLKGQFGKVFVLEEARLDVARSAHVRQPAARRRCHG